MDTVTQKSAITPFWEDVIEKYELEKEPIREQNYDWEKKLSKYRKRKKSQILEMCNF